MRASMMSLFAAMLIIFAVSVLDSAAQESSTDSSTVSSTESSTSSSSTSGSTSTTKAGSTSKTTPTKKPTTTKTTTSTTPKPPNCAGMNFKEMFIPSGKNKPPCCSPPPSPLLSFSKSETIAKNCSASDASSAIFSTFTLNKLQSTKSGKNNTFALNDTATIKTILTDACFVDCYLTRKNASINGTLDALVLVSLFNANQNDSWSNIIQILVSECTDLVAALELPSQTNPSKKNTPCYLTGYLVTQCVLFGAIGTCPTESRVYNKTGTTCNTLWPAFDKCSAQLLSSIGYTDTSPSSAPLKNSEKQTVLRSIVRKRFSG
ncbi:serine-rich adhesin for platelets-like [Neocloeon triangulifer]|uniref:serine-rich adhesin for platelets-like n=1 Tax=Neocloeon triangulifer TaxID=2078957 RepID=UPI00286F069C|nr:serine-rich adhesin for platelets-like [Neocloeon triangulifer]